MFDKKLRKEKKENRDRKRNLPNSSNELYKTKNTKSNIVLFDMPHLQSHRLFPKSKCMILILIKIFSLF